MKKIKENKAINNLAFLVESELEKAQVVLAAKGILDKMQKMAEDLAKVEADDIMPMLDSMRLTFGTQLTDSFNDVSTAKLRQTMEAIKDAKEAITKEVARMEKSVNGEGTSDMDMDDMGDNDDLDMDSDMGDDDRGEGDLDMGGDDTDHEADLDMSGDEPEEDDTDLDAAFDNAAQDTTAAGRAKKESVERNIKALKESRNPDRLILETFRRTLTESKNATLSARAVARAFSIDLGDVISIVRESAKVKKMKNDPCEKGYEMLGQKEKNGKKVPNCIPEGKTFKDEQGKTNKNKDWTQARKDKKRDRPSEMDEAAKLVGGQKKLDKDHNGKLDAEDFRMMAKDKAVEEGKTFKDEKGKTNKNKDWAQARKDKRRDRPTELDEANFFSVPPKQAPAFGKMPNKNKIPTDFESLMKSRKRPVSKDAEVTEKFDMKPTAPSKKGMFDGKTKEELQKELNALKASGPHHKGSPEFTKERELQFAIRAKSGWKANESKGFNTGAVVKSERDAAASTRKITEAQLFSNDHLERLKKEYATIDKIDPSLPTYGKITKMLGKMSQDQLKQIAGADIKFLSSLARNRIKKGINESMSLEDAKKIVGKTNSMEPYLSNMIKALSMMPAMNTPEEDERLKAAKMVKASLRKKVRESNMSPRRQQLKKDGYMVRPMADDPKMLGKAPWFWSKEEYKNGTVGNAEIQNGHSPSEEEAWRDLERHMDKKTSGGK